MEFNRIRNARLPTSEATSTFRARPNTSVGNEVMTFVVDAQSALWRFAQLSDDRQKKAISSRSLVRYMREPPDIASIIQPTSVHGNIAGWKWPSASSHKILVKLNQSYSVPLEKYPTQSNIGHGIQMKFAENVLMPGTLRHLPRKPTDPPNVYRVEHRSDRWIAVAGVTRAQTKLVAVAPTKHAAITELQAFAQRHNKVLSATMHFIPRTKHYSSIGAHLIVKPHLIKFAKRLRLRKIGRNQTKPIDLNNNNNDVRPAKRPRVKHAVPVGANVVNLS